eukprot:gnl/TRDRNA2_/TRDRNA2_176111_c0_seq28.p1 gnl/TRDRNA2_/TRDRNA2_176111_c0~~gnl/TRDRNA2_/TRDRNA2_176111_c0_seq28.p1  ORF type:complete len:363 (-),score=27.75 gnl/TRDRNA2_/TRDRNA2_176111_c0_seq28:162-1166(-)
MWNVVWLDGRARLLDTLNSPDMLYDAEHLKRLASGSHRQGGRAGLGSLSVPRSSIHRDPTDIYRESYDSDGDPEQHEGTNLLAHFERRQLFHGELVDVKCRRLGWVHGHVTTSQQPGRVAIHFHDHRSGLLCRKHLHPESMNLHLPATSSGEDEHDPGLPYIPKVLPSVPWSKRGGNATTRQQQHNERDSYQPVIEQVREREFREGQKARRLHDEEAGQREAVRRATARGIFGDPRYEEKARESQLAMEQRLVRTKERDEVLRHQFEQQVRHWNDEDRAKEHMGRTAGTGQTGGNAVSRFRQLPPVPRQRQFGDSDGSCDSDIIRCRSGFRSTE